MTQLKSTMCHWITVLLFPHLYDVKENKWLLSFVTLQTTYHMLELYNTSVSVSMYVHVHEHICVCLYAENRQGFKAEIIDTYASRVKQRHGVL